MLKLDVAHWNMFRYIYVIFVDLLFISWYKIYYMCLLANKMYAKIKLMFQRLFLHFITLLSRLFLDNVIDQSAEIMNTWYFFILPPQILSGFKHEIVSNCTTSWIVLSEKDISRIFFYVGCIVVGDFISCSYKMEKYPIL